MPSTLQQDNTSLQEPKAGLHASNRREAQFSEYHTLPESIRNFVSEDFWNSLTIEQRNELLNLEKNTLPAQLTGVVPETVWVTLSMSQRFEFFIDSLKKGRRVIENRVEPIDLPEEESGVKEPTNPEAMDMQKIENEADREEAVLAEMAEAVKDIRSIEAHHSEVSKSSDLSQVERKEYAPVDQFNSDIIANIGIGYVPSSEALVQDPKAFLNKPDTTQSVSWVATLLSKIGDMLRQGV